MSVNVKIYVKDPCPFCDRAIRLLKDLNIEFEEIDLTDKDEEIQKIKTETGWRTFPFIMISRQDLPLLLFWEAFSFCLHFIKF